MVIFGIVFDKFPLSGIAGGKQQRKRHLVSILAFNILKPQQAENTPTQRQMNLSLMLAIIKKTTS